MSRTCCFTQVSIDENPIFRLFSLGVKRHEHRDCERSSCGPRRLRLIGPSAGLGGHGEAASGDLDASWMTQPVTGSFRNIQSVLLLGSTASLSLSSMLLLEIFRVFLIENEPQNDLDNVTIETD